MERYVECAIVAMIAVASAIGCGTCGNDTTAPPVKGLSLSLGVEGRASNCLQPNRGGAGITAMSVTLQHTGGDCAPVTFARLRGTTQIGTYQVSCSAPPLATCIDTDETLVATAIDPGTYTVRVRGRLNAIDCYFVDSTFAVPATGQLMRKLELFRAAIPACPDPAGISMQSPLN